MTRLIPGPVKEILRSFAYHPAGIHFGVGSSIRRPFQIMHRDRIRIGNHSIILCHSLLQPIVHYAGVKHDPYILIGDRVYIGRYASINAMDRVQIGNDCVLSDFVYLNDSSHGFDPDAGPILDQPLESKGPILIGEFCFLGMRSVVMPGVTLGDRCIVGANSVVTRSFPPGCVLAGAPARLVRQYDSEQKQWVKPEAMGQAMGQAMDQAMTRQAMTR